MRTCSLVLTDTPPTTQTGWGVQFSRRVLGTTTWSNHGKRATSFPYTRDAVVNAGGWDSRAVWTRSGSATVERFRTVECH